MRVKDCLLEQAARTITWNIISRNKRCLGSVLDPPTNPCGLDTSGSILDPWIGYFWKSGQGLSVWHGPLCEQPYLLVAGIFLSLS